MTALVGDRALLVGVEHLARALSDRVATIEADLDALDADACAARSECDLEAVNAALVELKDAVWAIARDRLRTARAVGRLRRGRRRRAGPVGVYLSIQQALSALDRLEVRGRDSAGLHVLVRGHGLDLRRPALAAALAARAQPTRCSRRWPVRHADGASASCYKAAAEIGELGDNTARPARRHRRRRPAAPGARGADGAEAVVLGHTRWASVGIISQANAHPLNSEELDRDPGPYVTAVLNGDVDNFADLKATEALRIPAEITTDAKVIPTLVSRHLADGVATRSRRFRRTVDVLEGSVAIAAGAAAAPGDLFLALAGQRPGALRGPGRGRLHRGQRALRPGRGDRPATCAWTARRRPIPPTRAPPGARSCGCGAPRAGTSTGIERIAYDGTPLPVSDDELVRPPRSPPATSTGATPRTSC